MSKQTNFFAAPSDSALFHFHLMETFPGLMVMAGHDESKRYSPLPFGEVGNLNEFKKVYLVPQWGLKRIGFFPESIYNACSVDVNKSAVIEYSPCALEAEGKCLRVGGLYWAYTGKASSIEKSEIDTLLRWVRSKTMPIPDVQSFRMFEGARSIPLLRYWVGPPVANPLYRQRQ